MSHSISSQLIDEDWEIRAPDPDSKTLADLEEQDRNNKPKKTGKGKKNKSRNNHSTGNSPTGDDETKPVQTQKKGSLRRLKNIISSRES